MRKLTGIGVTVLATALVLTGCGDGGGSAGKDTDGKTASPTPSVPVAKAFGKPAWGVQVPVARSTDEEDTDAELTDDPLVTADRVVILTGEKLYAYDARGKKAWTGTVKGFAKTERRDDSNGYPLMRQVSSEVVAVVDVGMAKGDGIAEDTYQAKVTLLSLADGKVVKEVTVPGTDSGSPTISQFGLAFLSPEGDTVTTVKADGSTAKTPLPEDESSYGDSGTTGEDATDEAGAVGDATFVRTPDGGYKFPTWNTAAKSPIKDPSGTTIEVSDNDDLVVVSWNRADGFMSKGATGKALVRVSTGEVLAKVECETSGGFGEVFTASPNREYLVNGGLRVATSGDAECVGGGENEKTVRLQAVADDGRAFGGLEGGDQLVDVPAGGEPKTWPIGDVELPIGVLRGDIAVHWDEAKGVLTGNPIK